MSRWSTRISLVALLALCGGALAACSSGGSSETYRPPGYHDWPYFSRDLDATRYAPQTQISVDNLKHLGLAWSANLGVGQYLNEDYPIEVGRTLYVTTSTDEVQAYNAVTGDLKWQFAPQVNFAASTGVGGYGVSVNRGVAIAGGKLYELTFDDRLLALSVATGEQLWSSTVYNPGSGAYESMAPSVYHGLVYVGDSGPPSGGFAAAYDAKTGKQVWRFDTVPPPGTGWDPKKNGGGGDVYMPPTVDTRTGLVYLTTGNPDPALVGTDRPGPDLYSDSIVALSARTGKLVWYYQEIAHDLYDHDAETPAMIVEARIHGRTVRAVAAAGKSGYFFLVNARTGKPLHPHLAFVKIHLSPPTTRGTLECPGVIGGSQYSPLAFDPKTNAAYVSGINLCFIYKVKIGEKAGERAFEGVLSIPSKARASGTFSAVNLATGRFLWKRTMPTPMIGGATTTASGLVMTGDQHGILYIMSAKTGRTLWSAPLGLAFASAPIVYSIGRTEYIAAAIGGGATTLGSHLGPIGARIVVLKLGGRPIRSAAT